MNYPADMDQEWRPNPEWAKGRKLAENGDFDGLLEWCRKNDLDLRRAQLYIAILANDKQLAKVVADAEKAQSELGTVNAELGLLHQMRPTVAEANEWVARRDSLEAKRVKFTHLVQQAQIATIRRLAIKQHWPKLLGHEPVGEGEQKHWPPCCDLLPDELRQMLDRLGLPEGTVHPEQHFAPVAIPEKPARVIASPLLGGNQ